MGLSFLLAAGLLRKEHPPNSYNSLAPSHVILCLAHGRMHFSLEEGLLFIGSLRARGIVTAEKKSTRCLHSWARLIGIWREKPGVRRRLCKSPAKPQLPNNPLSLVMTLPGVTPQRPNERYPPCIQWYYMSYSLNSLYPP